MAEEPTLSDSERRAILAMISKGFSPMREAKEPVESTPRSTVVTTREKLSNPIDLSEGRYEEPEKPFMELVAESVQRRAELDKIEYERLDEARKVVQNAQRLDILDDLRL